MEIVIAVSVLSTLGVVAIVLGIVVAFRKLKSKVDVNEYHNAIDNLYQSCNQKIKDLERIVEENHSSVYREIQEVHTTIDKNVEFISNNILSVIDSRCDKLNANLKDMNSRIDNRITDIYTTLYNHTDSSCNNLEKKLLKNK
jgi:hypothetical protein